MRLLTAVLGEAAFVRRARWRRSSSASALEPRDRGAGPPHRRDGAAPPRRAGSGAQQLPRKAAAQAEGRVVAHPAFRRRAAPVPGDAAARRRRPRRRSGARAIGMRGATTSWSTPCCAACRARARRRCRARMPWRSTCRRGCCSAGRDAYGAEEARRIAAASLNEAPLDISVKSSPEAWAERLGGKVLPTGSVRLEAGGRIEDLPGYSDGGWWVQDAAASLPARLLGPVAGKSVADLCAAPGGKTAQLAAAGADVTAVDLSSARLQRLRDNLDALEPQGAGRRRPTPRRGRRAPRSTRCCSTRRARQPAPSAAIPISCG